MVVLVVLTRKRKLLLVHANAHGMETSAKLKRVREMLFSHCKTHLDVFLKPLHVCRQFLDVNFVCPTLLRSLSINEANVGATAFP